MIRFDVYRLGAGPAEQTVVRRQGTKGDVLWATSASCPGVASAMAELNQLPLKIDAPFSQWEGSVMLSPVTSQRWIWGRGAASQNTITVTADAGPVRDFTNNARAALHACWSADQPS